MKNVIDFSYKICRKLLLAGVLMASAAVSATVVVDDEGLPLVGASVFNRSGSIVGLTAADGQIPAMAESDYPLTVKFMGFKSVSVTTTATDSVMMDPLPYTLSEVTASAEGRPAILLLGYMREYTSTTTETDTATTYRDAAVDFMILRDKVKKVKEWRTPRVINERRYYHYNNNKGIDSVSSRGYEDLNLSFSSVIKLPRSMELPESLRNLSPGVSASDSVAGKYRNKQLWQVTAITDSTSNISLYRDGLADQENGIMSPLIFKILGMTLDITTFNSWFIMDNVGGDHIDAEDLQRMSFLFGGLGKGKLLKMAVGAKKPVDLKSYFEIYITDRRYLTADEAREWKDNPDRRIRIPDGIDPLDPATQSLVDRAQSLPTP